MTNDLTPLTYDMLIPVAHVAPAGIIDAKHSPLPTKTRIPSLADPCYVVAGNYNEFNSWMRNKGHNKLHYTYVSSIDTIRGLSDIHGLFIGTWRERKDIEEIKLYIDIIKNRQKVTAISTQQIYDDQISKAGDGLAKDIDRDLLQSVLKSINGGPISQPNTIRENNVDYARRLLEEAVAKEIAEKWTDSQEWTDSSK